MAKPEWGVKRACLACGTRFYDMRKNPIVCPSCSAKFDVESIFRPRRTRAPADETPVAPAAPDTVKGEDLDNELAALADDSVADDDDEEESTIEDTSDLADDDSDVPIVPKDISEESS